MKSKKIYLTFLCFLCYNFIFSQSISYKRNDDKSITFNYSSDVPGSVLIILTFTSLENASASVIKKTLKGYGGQIYTLNPLNSDESINFSYRSKIFYGDVKSEPEETFKYILPFKKGEKVKVRNLNFLGKKFGNSAPKNWKSWQFLTKLNDTVLAIRKGVVLSVSDEEKSDNTKKYGYKSKSNSIKIEHKDGTIATYSVLKENSIMVNVGDIVYPSAPIALAGSYDSDENSQVRLSIYYLDKKILNYDFNKRKDENLKNRTHLYSYINPYFYTLDGNSTKLEANTFYTGSFDNTVIELEMTKREKRKWKKNGLLIKKR
ncbi:peptidoglycan DD-metalloendopeptidase family protein [Polaribacter sp. Asnod6-C07]|uniref:peptidoglycan DD-metalloendopeptidase family protein n=1 Tax=Polaribacter sp. Asnod6-C07 TaxID=3160582 RepID=UPI0038693E1A